MPSVTMGLADPATYADGPPHAEFARRRREAPVAWVEGVLLERHSGGSAIVQRQDGYWAVTRHRAVIEASRAPEVFSSSARGPFLADPVSRGDLERNRQLLAGMDPPEHTRLRRVVTSVFTPATARRMRESIVDHAARVVARAVAGHEVDAVAAIAAELPLLVLADLLGIPRQDRGLFLQWSNHLIGFDDPAFGGGDVAVVNRTFVEAFAYAIEAGRAKRRRPAEDLVSRLVTAEVDGRRLTETEFCHLWLLLVVAGHETTRHLVSGGLELLAGRPDLSNQLAGRPDLMAGAVDEMLRWVTPIMQFRRTAQREVELDGTRISAGDKVVLYYISANRDESVFVDADRFDPGRSPNPHLAFGVGPHFCLGSHLARLEATTLFQELAPHLARLRPTGPPLRLRSNFMNGLKTLPVTFG
ncbi:cytochrome P450 [Solihabitans fulvus]|uniref:Cytochrome P450 n=1 Tax=Solihabitans fulvus TaxID=1892852 RepID=A0A5B2XSI6_9PSEU|nr:cytochrome P450 [Solihabitans fulvus]KAA2265819.1 cytochrome P450 [Solihabitans fulvus]